MRHQGSKLLLNSVYTLLGNVLYRGSWIYVINYFLNDLYRGRWCTDSLMMILDGSRDVVAFIGFNRKLHLTIKTVHLSVNYYKSVNIQSLQLISFQWN